MRSITARALLCALLALVWLGSPRTATAQTKTSCAQATSNIHVAVDCIEGLFSEPPVHLTLSSIPPGNGFPVGLVYEDAVHHLGGYKSLTDTTLTIVGSTNKSWYATASLTWLPPLHYTDMLRNGDACHHLGPLCTRDVMGVQIYTTHRSLNSLSFYGLGAPSPDTRYVFGESETYGGAVVRVPLANWLRTDGQIELRDPALHPDASAGSIFNNFNEGTAPGLTTQPLFLHSAFTLRTDATVVAERASNPLAGGAAQPLMKSRTVYGFQNNVGFHRYHDLNTGQYSFRQVVFDGDESIRFGAVLQRFVEPGSSALVRIFCSGNKATDTCDFGTLDVKTLVQLGAAGAGGAQPFYYQPTIGGSDIESRVSLRGFDNSRFRAPNASLLQIEFGRPIPSLDPLGAFVFYDAGLIGLTASDMWSSRLKQDGGAGLSVRLQGRVVLQVFVATGGGQGAKLGYNLAKLF